MRLILADVGIRGTRLPVPPEDAPDLRRLLGDDSQFGVNASCAVQEVPNGLAQAFLVGEEFVGGGSVALVLGDNLFYGPGVGSRLSPLTDIDGAAVFAYWVAHPEECGVVEFDDDFNALSLEEKPDEPKSATRFRGFTSMTTRWSTLQRTWSLQLAVGTRSRM